jgi:hypothetical protein
MAITAGCKYREWTGARRLALAFVLLAVLAATLPAQTTQGLIAGQIVDSQTGVPVENAQIQYEQLETNTRGSAATNGAGFYSLSLLPPGLYRVRIMAAGYQPQEVHELRLAVAGRIDLSLRLRPLSDVWEQGQYRSIFFPESEAVLTFYGPDVDTTRIAPSPVA